MVVVFNLGFGKGGVARAAPVDGLFGAHDAASFHKVGKLASGGGLVGGAHAHVGIFPVAKHAKTAKFLALHVNPLGSVVAAELAHHMGGQGLFLFFQFLLNLVLNGQTVAVPAGNIARGKARHVARFYNNILENLVQRRAHVDVPVGVRRAIVQHIGSLAARSLNHGFVAVNGIPLFQGFRLTLGQVCFHGKGGLRQVQCFLIIAHAGSRRSSTQGLGYIGKVKKSLYCGQIAG